MPNTCPAPCWTPTAKGVYVWHKNKLRTPTRKGSVVWATVLSWLSSLLLALLALCLVLMTTICSAPT